MAMLEERLEDLSVYYWLKDKFSTTPFVNIEDGFPEDALSLPTVSVEWDELIGHTGELGNRKTVKERTWYLDVFALNKSQRDDFVYKIYNDLDDGIPVYDYNVGFPPVVPPSLGTLIPVTRRIRNLHTQEDPVTPEKLYYRAVVIVTLVYDQY